MLKLSFFLAAAPIAHPIWPASQADLANQAALCRVSLRYEPRGDFGYAAFLGDGGRMLVLMANQDRNRRDCLRRWGESRGLNIVIMNH